MAIFLEKFYPSFPVWAQNFGISCYGLLYHRERFGGSFQKYVREFSERDHSDRLSFDQYVNSQLRKIITHAFKNVPYYRAKWKEIGISENDFGEITYKNLCKLPITDKMQLRMHSKMFLAENRKIAHSYSTSGSTGTPLTCHYGVEDHRKFIAAREVRSAGWAASTLRGSRAMIGGRLVVPRASSEPPFYRYNWVEKQVYFSAFHISPKNAKNYLDGFNRYKPELLTGYAHSYYLLAKMLANQNMSLDYEPTAAVLGSEKLTPEMKEIIHKVFRTRIYEEYGAVENSVLATECEKGQLHVSLDFGILEIVDEKGLPLPPGKEGRIICTGLINETQPLIRYEIGDSGTWSSENCDCGRNHFPVLREILGRTEDVVTGIDGRQMVRFHGIFVDLKHVLEGQVIQEKPNEFRVRVVTTPDFNKQEENIIKKRFFDRLGNVNIIIEKVSLIERTERGKFRAVISRVRNHGF